MLNSLDGTIVFGTFDLGVGNVTRHIMREKARAISGDKLVVYPSNQVLDVVSNNYCRPRVSFFASASNLVFLFSFW